MAKQKSFTIEAENYVQVCHRLPGDLFFFERTHHWEDNAVQVDVFGSFWSVALADFPPGQLIVRSKRGKTDFAGKHLFLVPPFSIIEWNIAFGPLKWSAYLSKTGLPRDLPSQPCAFPWTGTYYTREEEIFEDIRGAGIGIPIGKKETASRVAMTTKRWIDSRFQSDLKLGQLADEFGFSQAYITKEFKKCFGISPQSYINKVRAFEGMALLLLKHAKVNEASLLTGYADPSSFYQHFNREFRAKPSQYQS